MGGTSTRRNRRRLVVALVSAAALATGAIVALQPTATTAGAARIADVDDSSPDIRYVGDWSVATGDGKFDGGDRWTDRADSSAVLEFDGTGIAVHGAKAPWHGDMVISIDGVRAAQVSAYAAERADDVVLFSRDGLADGPHVVTVTATGTAPAASTGTVVAVDRFTTTAPVPAISVASAARADDTADRFTWTGTWQRTSGAGRFNGTDQVATAAGATATLTVAGSTIAVYGARGPASGRAAVSVDGGRETVVDTWAATRTEQQVLGRWTGLADTTHTVRIRVLGTRNDISTGTAVSVDRYDVSAGAEAPSAPASSGFVTREGNTLMLDGQVFRFAGANQYYLGLDDNIRDDKGNPTFPPQSRTDDALNSAVRTGATVVRSHTLGMSVGCAVCIEPRRGVFDDTAFRSADYAIYRAGKLGLKLMIPLVDQWRWYHGGISTFTGWRGYTNNPDVSRNASNNQAQRASEAHFYTDPNVIADFRQYVRHILEHVNPYTGLAYKDDPTIMAWETGNEIWTANPDWTQQLASFIKHTVGAKQLVADGTAATGMSVSNAAIDAPDVDIVGGHFYPVDVAWMQRDAAVAAAHDKAYVVGEFDWTDKAATAKLLAAVEKDRNISGDLYWVLMPHLEDGSPEIHGEKYAIWSPALDPAALQIQQLLTAHAKRMSLPS
ncbi:hypothetical protein GIS00_07290 [Nakamurella sp. YIM 132087]|uniref:mannan endo-1,4-beta-mannosidase n=1 Tax=Nakamurella alba TaxID=2665158 RepID=A0A7K1FI50_9ACTN|nr:hypothetical protein [Nakamurella alba]MTD13746.1 hypothetical protein [Nakamurella alba]